MVAAMILAALLIAVVVTGESAPAVPASGLASPGPDAIASPVGSPAATPMADQNLLFTPIPASEARNVVGRATIEMTDRGFIPSRFENAINQGITFTLVNTGTRLHNFSIDALDVHVDVAAGETTTLTIPSPRRLGQYVYYSDTPEDRALGMTGIMTIFI
jgi:hypothetical protein